MTTSTRLVPTTRAVRVAQVGVAFWVIKALSTAFGEAASDYLVHAMVPQLAVLLGFAAFVLALALQLRTGRYVPWRYWLAVSMVGLFGTMAADVVHVALGVPYVVTALGYGAALVVVFVAWRRTEGTLAMHSIDTPRREAFYWAAVVTTFALGTAAGDLTAYTLGLGYFTSAVIFAIGLLLAPVGYRWLRWNGVFAFWFAYVLTRPLGASLADGLGKPRNVSGLGLGEGAVALVLAVLIAALVWSVTTLRGDMPAGAAQDGA